MELTKEAYEDFMKRLHFHNKGKGVLDHGTADPLFIVQSRERIFGFDSGYSDDCVLVGDESEYETDEDIRGIVEDMEDDDLKILLALPACRTIEDFMKLSMSDKFYHLSMRGYRIVHYKDDWQYVNSHFTRDAAQAFIDRKKHDYRELRIYVESQYWCWEWNMIVKGFLDGKIGLIE